MKKIDCVWWDYQISKNNCMFFLNNHFGEEFIKANDHCCGKWEKYDAHGNPYDRPTVSKVSK